MTLIVSHPYTRTLKKQAHGANISLHLKIHIGQADYLRVCGYSAKDAMKRALFYLDANISNPAASYTPSDRVQLITTRKYVNDECTVLTSLPRGDHVLTIKTKPDGGSAFFSHLIMYE
jgi:hypothetical protein